MYLDTQQLHAYELRHAGRTRKRVDCMHYCRYEKLSGASLAAWTQKTVGHTRFSATSHRTNKRAWM